MTDTPTGDAPQPVYPLPPTGTTSPQLTYGLLFDIADALVRNGFPRPAGVDWAHLMLSLDRFLYQENP